MKKEKGFWIKKQARNTYYVYESEQDIAKRLCVDSFCAITFQRMTSLKCRAGEMFFLPQAGLKKIARLIKK